MISIYPNSLEMFMQFQVEKKELPKSLNVNKVFSYFIFSFPS